MTLVAVAVEVAAVGDRLVVALGDAPVVGDEDETAGRVERGVVDGLGVDVLVGDGLGVDVAVGDGDGLGVGDGQIKGSKAKVVTYATRFVPLSICSFKYLRNASILIKKR